MTLSVIIPTYQEAAGIGPLVEYLKEQTQGRAVEILVVDAQSQDGTAARAREAGAKVITSQKKSRACQMNEGARNATGEVLYFLHADTYPPAGFFAAIEHSIQNGRKAGCFQLQFNEPHWFLKSMGWCTRVPIVFFRFGDQSLFVTREVFWEVQGFREELLVMEDQDIVQRLQKKTRFALLPQKVTSSARKYLENGVVRLQMVFTLLLVMYYLGCSQQMIIRWYRKLIREKRIEA